MWSVKIHFFPGFENILEQPVNIKRFRFSALESSADTSRTSKFINSQPIFPFLDNLPKALQTFSLSCCF